MNRVILSAIVLLSFTAHAAADSRLPINVQAHTAVIDERLGFGTYTGNAKITQGSLVISAEKIQVFSKNQAITKVIALGTKTKLAHYKQNQSNRPRFIEATAINITYRIDKQLVHLAGKAHLIQGFDSFSGGTLDYDIKKDKIVAKKSKNGIQRVKFKIRL